jgi:hypothetical protein
LLDLDEEEFMILMVDAIEAPEAAHERCEELELSLSVVRQIQKAYRLEPVLSGIGCDS